MKICKTFKKKIMVRYMWPSTWEHIRFQKNILEKIANSKIGPIIF